MSKDRIAVNLLTELLEEVDAYIETKGIYDSRAEFIRDAIRRLLDDKHRTIDEDQMRKLVQEEIQTALNEDRLRGIVREEIQKALREKKNGL